MDPNNFGYNFSNYEKLFRHFGFGDDHLLREAISANILISNIRLIKGSAMYVVQGFYAKKTQILI